MKDDQSIMEVDSKFKSCPGPIMDLSEAVKNAEKGKIIRLIATDPAAPSDVKEWTSQVGHKVLKISEEKGVYEIDIEVG